MRDIIAALLLDRGYTHDDAADPDDMEWSHPDVGVRPLLACVAHEMDKGIGAPVSGWITYPVSVASRVRPGCICGDTYGPEDCPVHDGDACDCAPPEGA